MTININGLCKYLYSYVNSAFLTACLEYKVVPACLPPHTSHRLQPLDVAVFSPYKKAYRNLLKASFHLGKRAVQKDNFYQFISEARVAAFTPDNIRSGFASTGLVPLDFSVIHLQLVQELGGDDIWKYQQHFTGHDPSQLPRSLTPPANLNVEVTGTSGTSTPELIPAEHPDSLPCTAPRYRPTPPPLHEIPFENIVTQETPRKTRDLNSLGSSVLKELKSIEQSAETPADQTIAVPASSIAPLRAATEKIVRSGIRAILSAETERENIHSLKRTAEEVQRKGKRRRGKKIPAEGKAWLDTTDIQQFFSKEQGRASEQTLKKRSKKRAELGKAKAKLEGLKAEVSRRKELAKAGNLRKNMKSAETLEEEQILPLMQKLEKLRQNLVELGDGDEDGDADDGAPADHASEAGGDTSDSLIDEEDEDEDDVVVATCTDRL
jgi:hypothetical protein